MVLSVTGTEKKLSSPLLSRSFCHFSLTKYYYLCISEFSMQEDSPILAVELDMDELAKDHKA